MEFHVRIAGAAVDLAAVERGLLELDPAGVVDLHGTGLLRISTAAGAADLATVLAAAGHPVAPASIEQQPSVCCGGCSG